MRLAADDKQAVDIVVLDISKLTSIANYFVVMHGNSERQVKAIAEHIMESLKEEDQPVWHKEGLSDCQWVLLDFGSVIVHVFYRETREFYSLEKLWGEAPEISDKPAGKVKLVAKSKR